MCELDSYTVQTQRNVSRHNPRISSQQKCVNQLFTQFGLRGMCPDTIHNFQLVKMCELGICTVQTQRNVSGHNPTIYRQPKCVNQLFTQFGPGVMCLDTIPEYPAIQNV